MAYAVVVNDVYKKFGKPAEPLWKRLLKSARTNGHNGHNGNGASPQGGSAVKAEDAAKGSGNHAAARFTVAVDHVSFEVDEGEIFGVLGPNGGGKSTLIRLISTLLLPDSGEVKVFGYDVVRQPMKVQERINRVSVEASFFKKLSPMENLLYGARLYGLDGKTTRKQVYEILARLGLERKSIGSPMEEMSRGMQQKVAIARALLSHPRLLLLDEPTTGLDPRSKREVQAVIRELRRDFGTTMLLTTHDMVEAESLCDRIAIMDRGKVVALDTPAALKLRLPQNDGKEATLEDVFLALTGKQLKSEEEMEAS
jgi:ABC-2 type transport system ATP-binding protein